MLETTSLSGVWVSKFLLWFHFGFFLFACDQWIQLSSLYLDNIDYCSPLRQTITCRLFYATENLVATALSFERSLKPFLMYDTLICHHDQLLGVPKGHMPQLYWHLRLQLSSQHVYAGHAVAYTHVLLDLRAQKRQALHLCALRFSLDIRPLSTPYRRYVFQLALPSLPTALISARM